MLEAKVPDLHHQLRGEIKKNQNMEEVNSMRYDYDYE